MMTLLEHLKEAARHLKEATIFVDDWRVREAVAGESAETAKVFSADEPFFRGHFPKFV